MCAKNSLPGHTRAALILEPDLLAVAEEAQIAVFRTPMVTMRFINAATIAMEVDFSPSVTEFGSMVDVLGIGVLIRGQSGIGKSECVAWFDRTRLQPGRG